MTKTLAVQIVFQAINLSYLLTRQQGIHDLYMTVYRCVFVSLSDSYWRPNVLDCGCFEDLAVDDVVQQALDLDPENLLGLCVWVCVCVNVCVWVCMCVCVCAYSCIVNFYVEGRTLTFLRIGPMGRMSFILTSPNYRIIVFKNHTQRGQMCVTVSHIEQYRQTPYFWRECWSLAGWTYLRENHKSVNNLHIELQLRITRIHTRMVPRFVCILYLINPLDDIIQTEGKVNVSRVS
jgi:hypothetical protein